MLILPYFQFPKVEITYGTNAFIPFVPAYGLQRRLILALALQITALSCVIPIGFRFDHPFTIYDTWQYRIVYLSGDTSE